MINILDKLINNKKPVVDKPIRCNKIEKLLDAKQQLEKSLKEGEIICSKCEGVGYTDKIKSNNAIIFKNKCSKCLGTGKLDWIENVVGKKPMYNDGTSMTNISFT